MVLMLSPSIILTCTPPLPTIPKLAAVPTASRLGAWGDHLRQVKEVGYLVPYWRRGLSISYYEIIAIIMA